MKTYLLIPTCLVLAFSCKKDPPVVPEPTLLLTAVDASCIEAWLRVTTTDIPVTARLLRDGQPVSVLDLRSPDSLLVDEGLLPKQTYTYQLQRLAPDSSVIETSPAIGGMQVTTMDTTSSNWSFTIDTLGVTSSVLYDVAIISDTNIWAVGELFLRDSSGVLDPRRYNLARWDGTAWTIERLMYQGSPPVLRSIFAFTENDIWLDPWFHWNGQSILQVPIDPIFIGVGVNKMWGSTDGRLYVVGNGGFIAERSSAGTWRQLESGTGLPMQDVFGALNGRTGELDVIAVAGDPYHSPERKILRISGSSATPLSDSGINWALTGVWFCSQRYWVVGSGVWYKPFTINCPTWINRSNMYTQFTTTRIKGNSSNDLYIVGHGGEILHFNGATMQSFREGREFYGYYNSVDAKDGLVIAVGTGSFGIATTRAVILRGRKAP